MSKLNSCRKDFSPIGNIASVGFLINPVGFLENRRGNSKFPGGKFFLLG